MSSLATFGKQQATSLVNWYFHRRRYAARWQRRLVRLRALSACEYCGRYTSDHDGRCDHIVPYVAGGWTSIFNLAWSCDSCNRLKGPRSPQQWRPVTLKHFRKGIPS